MLNLNLKTIEKTTHLLYLWKYFYDSNIPPAMLTSETYLGMFREMLDIHLDTGPFNFTFSNVPIWIEHNIQLAENVSQEEDRYSREYVPELGKKISVSVEKLLIVFF